jgi:orotate phosphoribosyltransferase
VDAFSVRKKAKEHGTAQRVEGGLPTDAVCLVVEDCLTTGASALAAVEAVREHGASVIGVLALVDRGEGGGDRIAAEGLPVLAIFSGAELLAATRAGAGT